MKNIKALKIKGQRQGIDDPAIFQGLPPVLDLANFKPEIDHP